MEFLLDPGIWVGLLTLIVLDIVLGIDNLVFIAILAEKLPPEQRDKARVIGLSLALIMRLGLLFAISWLVTLTQPLITVFDWNIVCLHVLCTWYDGTGTMGRAGNLPAHHCSG